jgi:hypothetical protein
MSTKKIESFKQRLLSGEEITSPKKNLIGYFEEGYYKAGFYENGKRHSVREYLNAKDLLKVLGINN